MRRIKTADDAASSLVSTSFPRTAALQRFSPISGTDDDFDDNSDVVRLASSGSDRFSPAVDIVSIPEAIRTSVVSEGGTTAGVDKSAGRYDDFPAIDDGDDDLTGTSDDFVGLEEDVKTIRDDFRAKNISGTSYDVPQEESNVIIVSNHVIATIDEDDDMGIDNDTEIENGINVVEENAMEATNELGAVVLHEDLKATNEVVEIKNNYLETPVSDDVTASKGDVDVKIDAAASTRDDCLRGAEGTTPGLVGVNDDVKRDGQLMAEERFSVDRKTSIAVTGRSDDSRNEASIHAQPPANHVSLFSSDVVVDRSTIREERSTPNIGRITSVNNYHPPPVEESHSHSLDASSTCGDLSNDLHPSRSRSLLVKPGGNYTRFVGMNVVGRDIFHVGSGMSRRAREDRVDHPDGGREDDDVVSLVRSTKSLVEAVCLLERIIGVTLLIGRTVYVMPDIGGGEREEGGEGEGREGEGEGKEDEVLKTLSEQTRQLKTKLHKVTILISSSIIVIDFHY